MGKLSKALEIRKRSRSAEIGSHKRVGREMKTQKEENRKDRKRYRKTEFIFRKKTVFLEKMGKLG